MPLHLKTVLKADGDIMSMKKLSPIATLIIFGLTNSFTSHGLAATLGGVVTGNAAKGQCSYSLSTPLNTVQDTYNQTGGTTCFGQSSSATVSGDAATATVSNSANSSGNKTSGSSAAFGDVQLHDSWLVSAPIGTPINSYITVPVEISIQGSVSADAQAYYLSNFLTYNLSISDKYDPLAPGNNFSVLGNITTTGSFSQTFIGSLNLYNKGSAAFPFTAMVAMILDSSIYEGSVDIKSSIKLDLPNGFAAFTSSGKPLNFGTTGPSPVPLPAAFPLMAAGISGMGLLGWRRKRKANTAWS